MVTATCSGKNSKWVHSYLAIAENVIGPFFRAGKIEKNNIIKTRKTIQHWKKNEANVHIRLMKQKHAVSA